MGLGGAVVLHVAVACLLLGVTLLHPGKHETWGDKKTSEGAIAATMVSALPLPAKVPPVEHQVLAEEKPTEAPATPPKEKTVPPPKPTDIPVKSHVDTKVPTKAGPTLTPDPPKHPQPTPDSPKATSGPAATQIAPECFGGQERHRRGHN